jgi:Na+:H+ antiporter
MQVHVSLTEVLAFVALAIMIAPTVAGWVRMPGLIGFVLAGALFGPYILGILPAGAVDQLGQIGLLYLMFQAGLEIDMVMFKKNRNAALTFGLLGFVFPFVFGLIQGHWLLGFSLAAAALLGSIFASHTLVTLPDVREAGLGSSRAVTTTAGATILTDTLALIVLAVTTAEASSPIKVVTTVFGGLVVLAIYCLVVLPWVGKRFFRGTGQSRTFRFAFMLFAFASAGVLAEVFGIEGLVGAFLAGLGVNRLAPKGGPLLERVDFFGEALFVPAFLVYVGTKLNPAVMIKPATIAMALGFMVVLLGGKGLASIITGRALEFSLAESGLMFGMTVPQAAATLAATLVGAQVGLLNEQAVNAVVVIVLVSIVLGSVLTRRFAAKIELPAGATRPIGSAVLVGLPAATPVDVIVRIASALAAEDDGLVMPVAVTTEEEGRRTTDASAIAKAATRAAAAQGADVEARVRYAPSYSGAMLEAMVDRGASVLVTPLRSDRGFVGRFFGGELDRIGRESPIPVIAVASGPVSPTKVVLGLDSKADSPAERHEQQLATDVARALSGRLELPLAVGGRTEDAIDALGLPEIAEKVVGPSSIVNHPEVLVPGSILVVPASLVRRRGPLAVEFERSHPEVTSVVVAGPHRLRTTFGRQADSLTGAFTMSATPETPEVVEVAPTTQSQRDGATA